MSGSTRCCVDAALITDAALDADPDGEDPDPEPRIRSIPGTEKRRTLTKVTEGNYEISQTESIRS